MTKGGRIPRPSRGENDARAAEAMKGQFGEGADQCTRGRPLRGGQAVRSPDEYRARVGVKAMPESLAE
jgi:hypothetical protein